MVYDKERVYEKIAFIREQKADIHSLIGEKPYEEIINDQWVIKGLKYSLQTSVEALIDIAYHLSAKHYKHAPADARDALQLLLTKGVLCNEEYEKYSSMVGFRNRVVHGYQQISNERVYSIAKEELHIFESFINQVLILLENDSKDK